MFVVKLNFELWAKRKIVSQSKACVFANQTNAKMPYSLVGQLDTNFSPI